MTSRYRLPRPEIIPNLLKVLELIVKDVKPSGSKSRKKKQDIYSSYLKVEGSGLESRAIAKTVGRRCIKLIVKCIQSHRFEEAAKLPWVLCQDKNFFDPFFVKAVMIVLENLLPVDQSSIVWKFFGDAQNLELVNKKEMQLEYIIYGLKNHIPDLQATSKELISRKKKRYLRKNKILDPILEAYCALLDYIEWKKSCHGEVIASQGQSAADKAIVKFKEIIEQPGQWDIFVLKLIEMLKYYDRYGEIEYVLNKYVEYNPNHINAYIYLCVYLEEHNPESEILIQNLQILAKMSPSDIRVLSLVQKLCILGADIIQCVEYLFMFIDYPSNGNNVRAWKMLSEVLHEAENRKEFNVRRTIVWHWKIRCRSWYWIYYNPAHVFPSNEKEHELIAYRYSVLSIFEPGHIYIKRVLKELPAVHEILSRPTPRNESLSMMQQEIASEFMDVT